MLAALVLVALPLLYLLHSFHWRRRGLPPGPVPVPLLGNLHSCLFASAESLYRGWARQFGPVYTYWMGALAVVSVHSVEGLHEAFVQQAEHTTHRYPFDDFYRVVRGAYVGGLIYNSGPQWAETRKFTIQVLREFGMGKNLMQERILAELNDLVADYKADLAAGRCEQAFAEDVSRVTSSLINTIMFNYRFTKRNAAEFRRLCAIAREALQAGASPLVYVARPSAAFFLRLPLFRRALARMAKAEHEFFVFFKQRIDDHIRDLDLHAERKPCDFVEAWLREMRRVKGTPNEELLTMTQLISSCHDIWLAGQETTANTITWGLAYLINDKDVLRKCQSELDRVIGSARTITTADMASLPYMRATINEIQRMANVIFQAPWRLVTKDITVQGHKIKKGTCIVPQISVLMSDEKVFPNASRFNPDRFLDENNNVKKIEECIPFSLGRRSCLGEGMARMELFLILANLLNQFEFDSTDGRPIDMTRRLGITTRINNYNVKIQARHATDDFHSACTC